MARAPFTSVVNRTHAVLAPHAAAAGVGRSGRQLDRRALQARRQERTGTQQRFALRLDEERVQREAAFAVVEQRVACDAFGQVVVERRTLRGSEASDARAVAEGDEARLRAGVRANRAQCLVASEGDDDVDLAAFERLVLESDVDELRIREDETAVGFLQPGKTVRAFHEFGHGAEPQQQREG